MTDCIHVYVSISTNLFYNNSAFIRCTEVLVAIQAQEKLFIIYFFDLCDFVRFSSILASSGILNKKGKSVTVTLKLWELLSCKKKVSYFIIYINTNFGILVWWTSTPTCMFLLEAIKSRVWQIMTILSRITDLWFMPMSHSQLPLFQTCSSFSYDLISVTFRLPKNASYHISTEMFCLLGW